MYKLPYDNDEMLFTTTPCILKHRNTVLSATRNRLYRNYPKTVSSLHLHKHSMSKYFFITGNIFAQRKIFAHTCW